MATQSVVRILEGLGWLFMPTGPDEWTWLLYGSDGRNIIARQGDEVWRRHVNFAKKTHVDVDERKEAS